MKDMYHLYQSQHGMSVYTDHYLKDLCILITTLILEDMLIPTTSLEDLSTQITTYDICIVNSGGVTLKIDMMHSDIV